MLRDAVGALPITAWEIPIRRRWVRVVVEKRKRQTVPPYLATSLARFLSLSQSSLVDRIRKETEVAPSLSLRELAAQRLGRSIGNGGPPSYSVTLELSVEGHNVRTGVCARAYTVKRV